MAGLIVTGVSNAKIDPKTCVGAWLFDEGKGDVAKDSSANGNNGTIVKSPKSVQGQFGTLWSLMGRAIM